MGILLGAIADDFTGATDLCNTLVREGMRAVQVIGVPDPATTTGEADAVVVALKSRMAPAPEAVTQSLAAHDWLVARGAQQVIEKYCSTFDSTPRGNIGPVTDALMDRAGAAIAVICPAVPENGRTVCQGHLFVGADLLSDSTMKDHPLTPMTDSSLVRLIEAQARGRAGVVPLATVRAGAAAIRAAIDALADRGIRYAVTDAIDDGDLRAIGRAVADHRLVTGGSGVALGLPGNFRDAGRLKPASPPAPPRTRGRSVVLAGSCSAATRAQLRHVDGRWPARRIDAAALEAGPEIAAQLADWAAAQPGDRPVVIYSSADPDEVRATQATCGREAAGKRIEAILGALAVDLTRRGFGNLIVAGGESSGAVVSALGVAALDIGPEIAPGVPWTVTLGPTPVALALKSGNFGGETFFEDAFGMLT